MDMKISENILLALIALPAIILLLYSLTIIIGNYWILRAGGQTAHENYPPVVEQLMLGFLAISVGFLLFFLVILGFVPSEVLVTLVSVAVGVLGTLIVKNKKN